MSTNPDDMAMPSHQALDQYNPNAFDIKDKISGGGLTKREYFAAAALKGLMANSEVVIVASPTALAEMAVIQANCLIKALNK